MSAVMNMLLIGLLITSTDAYISKTILRMSSDSFSASGQELSKASSTIISSNSANSIIPLKLKIFSLSAACDRGFAASPRERQRILDLAQDISQFSPETQPTRNFAPNYTSPNEITPLAGIWRMIFTTAFDVLSLAGSPLTTIQGIYQDIKSNGEVSNIIDIAPRLQSLLPQSLYGKGSTLRAKVGIEGRARSDSRVGLTFKRLELKPKVLFSSVDIADKLPPFKLNFPGIRSVGADVNAAFTSSGYFDILYLDEDLLIIKQNEPGGIFISIREKDFE